MSLVEIVQGNLGIKTSQGECQCQSGLKFRGGLNSENLYHWCINFWLSSRF